MQITVESKGVQLLFSELTSGDVFRHGGVMRMKTDEYDFNVINLIDGMLVNFKSDQAVEIPSSAEFLVTF